MRTLLEEHEICMKKSPLYATAYKKATAGWPRGKPCLGKFDFIALARKSLKSALLRQFLEAPG